LVFFGFTHCRIVCPRALGKLCRVLDDLGPLAERVQPLYVTVDPERDTPAVMREFLGRSYPRFTGLTGSPAQIDAAKAAFRVFARRVADPDSPGGYAMPHTAIAYLLDEAGRYGRPLPRRVVRRRDRPAPAHNRRAEKRSAFRIKRQVTTPWIDRQCATRFGRDITKSLSGVSIS